MELSQVIKELSIPFWEPFLAQYFVKAQESSDRDFLPQRGIEESSRIAGFEGEELTAVEDARRRVISNPFLMSFLLTLRYALYDAPIPPSFADFPSLELMDGGYGYNLLLVLNEAERINTRLSERSIPRDIIRDTLTDIAVWARFFRRTRGLLGFNKRILEWFQFHLSGKLFKLGRLQFVPYPFPNDIKVFRKGDGTLVAFAGPGQSFNAEGYSFLPGTRDEKAFSSTYVDDGLTITANPILPEGRVLRDTETVYKAGLTLELEKGTPMLDYHIQEGAPLDIEKCRESMARALEFFPEFFPEEKFAGFMGRSWLLDPRFKRILKPDSNIVKFMNLFFLYPFEGEFDEGLWRIFGDSGLSRNLSVFSEETGMQKSAASYLRNGNMFGEGGAFILVRDFLSEMVHRR